MNDDDTDVMAAGWVRFGTTGRRWDGTRDELIAWTERQTNPFARRQGEAELQRRGWANPIARVRGDVDFAVLPARQWGAVSGADAPPGIRVRGVWDQRGSHLHAWVRVDWPDGRHVLIHGTTDLEAIEREMGSLPQSVQAGFFGGLKKLVRKTGLGKVVSTVTNVARKAINNPLIKGALMATPMGQAAYGIAKGAAIAQQALKGGLNAKNFLRFAYQHAARGNPVAQRALGLIRAGVRQNIPALRRMMPRIGAAAGYVDRAWVGACVGEDPASVSVSDADLEIDQTQDAILTFAAADHFGGMRWLADRMKLQPFNDQQFGLREARGLGIEAATDRFAS